MVINGDTTGFYTPYENIFIEHAASIMHSPLSTKSTAFASYMQGLPDFIVTILNADGSCEDSSSFFESIITEFSLKNRQDNDDRIDIRSIATNQDTGNYFIWCYFTKESNKTSYYPESQHIVVEMNSDFEVIRVVPFEVNWDYEYIAPLYVGDNQFLVTKIQNTKAHAEANTVELWNFESDSITPLNSAYFDCIDDFRYIPVNRNVLFGHDNDAIFQLPSKIV